MTGRIVELIVWLGTTVLAAGSLYWGFLNASESSVLMLGLSAVLLVAVALVISVAVAAVVLRVLGESRRSCLVQGTRRAHWVLLAMACGGSLAWGVLQADAWVARHAGEISAWFIATLNWSDVTALFSLEAWLSVWVRWVVVPAVMLAAVASVVQGTARSLLSSRWIRGALRWRTLIIGTLAFAVLIELPWRLTGWRPGVSAPLSLEPALAALRLAVVALAGLAAAAVMVLTTVETQRTSVQRRPDAS